MKKNLGKLLALYPMPVLFEFTTYEYLKTGDVLGKCLSFRKTAGEE